MAAVLEPLGRRDPNNPRIASVWGLFCGAVRELGSDREASERLVGLLDAPRKLQVRGEHGNNVKHEWGSRYWADLPTFALDVSGVRDMWVSGTSSGLPFRYSKLVTSNQPCETRIDSDEAYYVKSCMSEALAGPYLYDTPESRYRAAVYVPAPSA
ncbi:hypothetical protein DL770_007281 [Monosporascus sp. CRB-9-2]|nr:hypothetical protein DL770_007281 [Monosporascus sp. CRB-9-2]